MNVKAIGVAVSLSALVSVCINIFMSVHWRQSSGDSLRTKRIEIVDDQGRVRGVIGTARIGGRQMPQVAFIDERGRISVLLQINERGEGTLFFSSRDKEGKVAIGYLSGSDVGTGDGGQITDEKDTLGAWGVSVLGPGLRTLDLAYGNAGQRFVPAQE